MSVYIDKKLVAVNGYEFNVYLEELKNRFQDKRITWNDEPDVLLTTALQQTYELAKRKPDVVLADELPDITNENTIYLIKKYDDKTLTVGRFILLTDELNALHYIGPTAGDVFTDVDQLPTTGISKLTIYRLKKYLYKYNNEQIPKPAGFKSLDPSVVEITPSGIIHHLDSDEQEIIYHPWDAVTDAIVFDLELRGYVAIDYDFADASFFRLGTVDTYVYHTDVIEEITYPLYHNPSETTDGYILIGSDTEIDEKTIVKNNQSKLQAKAILDVVTLPTTDILPNTVYRIIEISPIRMVKLFTYDFNRSTWVNHSRISISEEHYAELTSQQKNDGTIYIVEDSDEFYIDLTYETLPDKPAINGVTLLGELTLDDLSIYSKTDVDNLLANKASALFVDELPTQPIALTWYYSKKFEDGTIVPNDKRALYITDNELNYNYMGTIGDVDLSDYVSITRKVGSNTLENDITAQQLFNDTKDVIGTVTNKTINADNNTLTEIEADNFKDGAIVDDISDDFYYGWANSGNYKYSKVLVGDSVESYTITKDAQGIITSITQDAGMAYIINNNLVVGGRGYLRDPNEQGYYVVKSNEKLVTVSALNDITNQAGKVNDVKLGTKSIVDNKIATIETVTDLEPNFYYSFRRSSTYYYTKSKAVGTTKYYNLAYVGSTLEEIQDKGDIEITLNANGVPQITVGSFVYTYTDVKDGYYIVDADKKIPTIETPIKTKDLTRCFDDVEFTKMPDNKAIYYSGNNAFVYNTSASAGLTIRGDWSTEIPRNLHVVNGMVYLSFHVVGASTANGANWTTIGTVPSGLRPKQRTTVLAVTYNNGTNEAGGGDINTNGVLRVWCNPKVAGNNYQVRVTAFWQLED